MGAVCKAALWTEESTIWAVATRRVCSMLTVILGGELDIVT